MIIPNIQMIEAALGLPTWHGTVGPRTTSNDNWLTTGGQTAYSPAFAAGNASERGLLNAWKRSQSRVVELADIEETGRDSGIWKADGTGAGKFTLDGLHDWKASYAAIAASGAFSALTAA